MRYSVTYLSLLLVFASLTGCGGGNVTLKFGSYTRGSRALSATTLCFKRLRFKTANESTSSDVTQDSDNVDFAPGQVTFSDTGASLGSVSVPAGTYTRLEFDLEKNATGCTSGKSVVLTNSNGSFTSQDRVTIKFEGSFTATTASKTLTLGVQTIVDALNSVAADGDIKTNLESASVKGTL